MTPLPPVPAWSTAGVLRARMAAVHAQMAADPALAERVCRVFDATLDAYADDEKEDSS